MTFSTDQFRLDGKVAIVTGAGGRGNSIGGAHARGLAAAGASLVVADLNPKGARAVADEIVAAGAGPSRSAWTSPVSIRWRTWPGKRLRRSAASRSSSTMPR
ncbi:MAG TPA: hypothetical protein VF463_04940 [Sphingobium sp.]